MLIQRGQLIVGRDAVEIRDVMRELGHRAHTVRALATALGIGDAEAGDLVSALIAEGLVEPEQRPGPIAFGSGEDRDSATFYTTTISGNALGKARIGKPMTRAQAQELLDGVLRRAEAVNSTDEWLHWVEEIVLYGSFGRPGDEPVGDIDLGVRIRQRHPHAEYVELQDDMIDRDDANPATHLDRIFYAQRKVVRHLRGRSSRVDLVELHDDCYLPPNADPVQVYNRPT